MNTLDRDQLIIRTAEAVQAMMEHQVIGWTRQEYLQAYANLRAALATVAADREPDVPTTHAPTTPR